MAKTAAPAANADAATAETPADPYAGLVVTTAPVKFALPAPALPDSLRSLAASIAGAAAPTYINVTGWDKPRISALARALKGNADTLFPGKRLRVTQGVDKNMAGSTVLKFALSVPREAK